MNVCRFRAPCVAVLWTLAVGLMCLALIERKHELGDLAVLVGLVACIPSGWLIVEHVVHRAATQAVLDICEAVGYAEAEGKLRHLR